MPLMKLKNAKLKRVGIKQSTRALMEDKVERLYIAQDADQHVIRRIVTLAEEKGVEIITIDTMHHLGLACSIDVGAATAVEIKE